MQVNENKPIWNHLDWTSVWCVERFTLLQSSCDCLPPNWCPRGWQLAAGWANVSSARRVLAMSADTRIPRVTINKHTLHIPRPLCKTPHPFEFHQIVSTHHWETQNAGRYAMRCILPSNIPFNSMTYECISFIRLKIVKVGHATSNGLSKRVCVS